MNCIIVEDDELARHALETMVAETDFLTLVKSCVKASEAKAVLKKEEVDLIFLDVKLPGMNGIELLKTFEDSKAQVVMITADKSFAAEAFDQDVCDFIVKPITRTRFIKAVHRAKRFAEMNKKGTAKEALFIKVNSVLKRVNLQDVLFIEAMADYMTVNTPNNKYVLKSTMKNMMDRLPPKEFVRVHNSFIVRIDKITSIEDARVFLSKKEIPISRNRRKNFLNTINLLQ